MANLTSLAHSRLGESLIGIGVLHNVVGGWLYRDQIQHVARRRFWDTAQDFSSESEALWFMTTGTLMIVSGALVRSQLRATENLPMAASVGLAAAALPMVVTMPRSGGWLVLVAGLAAIRISATDRRRR